MNLSWSFLVEQVSRSALYALLIERATYKYKELNEKRSTEYINEDSKSLLLRARAREYELFRLCSQRERKKKNSQQLFSSYVFHPFLVSEI